MEMAKEVNSKLEDINPFKTTLVALGSILSAFIAIMLFLYSDNLQATKITDIGQWTIDVFVFVVPMILFIILIAISSILALLFLLNNLVIGVNQYKSDSQLYAGNCLLGSIPLRIGGDKIKSDDYRGLLSRLESNMFIKTYTKGLYGDKKKI